MGFHPERGFLQEDWRNWSGAVLADPYFESIGKYTIMPDLPYSESVKDDELKVKWEQCAKSIKNNSWLAIYAKADGEFNMHIRNMITQCNNYGYADCLEWSKGEAATKWRLTQELNGNKKQGCVRSASLFLSGLCCRLFYDSQFVFCAAEAKPCINTRTLHESVLNAIARRVSRGSKTLRRCRAAPCWGQGAKPLGSPPSFISGRESEPP